MIVKIVLDIFHSLMNWFVNIIPDVSLPLDISGYIAPVANAVGYVDTFVSLPVIVACLTAVLIVDNWTIIVRLALKIWELLPFN